MYKKLLPLITIVILAVCFTAFYSGHINAVKQAQIKVGDYISFGKYYGKPILWRVINYDPAKGYLLLSEKILCLKPFDAAGDLTDTRGTDARKQYGSNYWEKSNIRLWLNSESSKVDYQGQKPPSKENIYLGYNPYNNEPGFLANFTSGERKLINPAAHRCILAFCDKSERDGGIQKHIYNENIGKVLTNYKNAFYSDVTDKVFLPDIDELKEYVYDRKWPLIKAPTVEAVKNSNYVEEYFKSTEKWFYYLRTPYASTSNWVRIVQRGGGISYGNPFRGDTGIVPALYIKPGVPIKSGDGTLKTPYTLDPTYAPSPNPTPVPIPQQPSAVKLKTGDYVWFGRYYKQPVLWRIINIDKEKGALLFSERILSLKPFDAKGDLTSEGRGDSYRVEAGSNYWKESNIREWLNSKLEKVKYTCNPPSDKWIWEGYNNYEGEPGFLNPDNFTVSEYSKIKTVRNKSLLGVYDKQVRDGGMEIFINSDFMESFMQNYDSAYYEMLDEKVFLLDVKEVYEYLYKCGWDYRRKPTVQAVQNSEFYDDFLLSSRSWFYWLRTPLAAFTGRQASVDNGVTYNVHSHPCFGDCGIAPALYLEPENTKEGGDGSQADPYLIR